MSSSADPTRKFQAGAPAAGGAATATATGERMRPVAFVLVFIAVASVSFGQSIAFSTVPPIIRELGLRDASVSLIYAVPAIISAVLSPIWGRRSDKVGRRPVMLIGLIGFSVAGFLFAISAGLGLAGFIGAGAAFGMMIASRAVFGFTTPGLIPAGHAYIAERTTREERTPAIATLGAAMGTGTALGPAVGGLLVVFGLMAPFYATACLSLIVAALVYRFLVEGRPPVENHQGVGDGKWLSPRDPRILPFLVNHLANALTASCLVSSVAFYFADTLNLSGVQTAQYVGAALTTNACATLFSQLVIVRTFRPSARLLMRVGAVVVIVSLIAFIGADTYMSLLLALVGLGLGAGMFQPGSSAGMTLSVAEHEMGAAGGLTGTVYPIGFAVGPLISLPLYEVWQPAPYLIGLGMMTIALCVSLFHPTIRALGPHPTQP